MKKILVLLSMVAFASGAWAEVYSYSLAVHGFPYPTVVSTLSPDMTVVPGLPSDTIMTLVDKSTGSKFMTVYLKDLGPASYVEEDGTYEGGLQNINANGQAYGNYQTSWSVGVDNVVGYGYYLKIDLTKVKFPDGTYSAYIGQTHEGINPFLEEGKNRQNYLDDLVVVISSEQKGLTQTAAIAKVDSGVLSSEIAYNPVPEPTSGSLLLLGVAGLALKRKKAA